MSVVPDTTGIPIYDSTAIQVWNVSELRRNIMSGLERKDIFRFLTLSQASLREAVRALYEEITLENYLTMKGTTSSAVSTFLQVRGIKLT
jgi:hypothetical protein